MSLDTREYQEVDRTYVWNTYVNSMKGHIEKMWGWDRLWQDNDFEKSLESYKTELILSEGERIGYLQTKQGSDCTFINMFILEPQYRSNGLGQKILDLVQSTKPDISLELKCFQVNRQAYNFYLRCGFKVVSSDEYFINMRRDKIS